VKTRSDLRQVERIIIKIGSRLLAEDTDDRVTTLAAEARRLRDRGVDVVIVTSGAIRS
jgi:glutamate 5-kinase